MVKANGVVFLHSMQTHSFFSLNRVWLENYAEKVVSKVMVKLARAAQNLLYNRSDRLHNIVDVDINAKY